MEVDIMLREISQAQTDKHCTISLLCGTKRVHFIETESKKVAKGGEG
jgi:hypothetical protein